MRTRGPVQIGGDDVSGCAGADKIAAGKTEGKGALERLLNAYPDYGLAHNDLGVLCYNEGNKSEALHHYEKAAQVEPFNDTYQKNLADFYYVEAGRMGEALQIYVKLLETNPTDIENPLYSGADM